jgi:predicted ATP-dependent endonuclease of OLD family
VLNKPITIYSCLTENRKWLLDVILDSKIDLNGVVNLLNAVQGRETVRGLQGLVYVNLIANIQQLFSSILGRQVALGLNLRNQGSRINIIDSTTGAILVPSLDHLSTGQTILINMFLSIVRYVEHGNINRSLTLNNIKGIVVIDEIEQHLHAVLQREVLPHLIKLFPKVQFIITSHSPLFLLGMQECFGENGFDLYEMPSGIKINTERFSEFQKSYEYYKQTKQFEFDVRVALNSIQVNEKKFILYTEGPSDVIHLNTAWKKLHSNQEMPFDIISLDCASKLRMFLVAYSERQIDKTAIGLFDFDETGLKEIKEINAKTEIEECIYKLNNKDAYAIRIPCNEVNMIRIKNCPIEFLYKRELLDRYSMLEKISFTEFNGRYKPTSPDESKIWSESKELFLYKLTEQSNSKMSFANQINEDSGLTKEDFEGFKALFDKILRIVEPSKIVEP